MHHTLGESEVEGARASADRVLRLEDEHLQPGPGHGDCGGQAVRPGSHHDDVCALHAPETSP